MELIVAGGTALAGAVTAYGSLELGVGWSDHGPEPGYFPFYVGLLLILASVGNAVLSVVRMRGSGEVFIEREQLLRIAGFVAPMVIFVVVTVFLGLYVGVTLYLFYSAWRQGKYNPVLSLGLGAGFAVALYVVFEILFKVPLHKGPLEQMLGIY
jgi:hypothetical protein